MAKQQFPLAAKQIADMDNIDPNRSYTTHQASKAISVSLRTIQLWCESGILPHRLTLGGHRRILGSVILDHLEKSRVGQSEKGSKRTLFCLHGQPEFGRLPELSDSEVIAVETAFELFYRLGRTRNSDAYVREEAHADNLKKVEALAEEFLRLTRGLRSHLYVSIPAEKFKPASRMSEMERVHLILY